MTHLRQSVLRCSPMYLFYFAFLGLFLPYLGRYLTSMGFDGAQVGVIMACITGANLYAPFLLSRLSDRSGRPVRLLRLGFVLMWVTFALTLVNPGYLWQVFSFALFGTFFSAVLPQMENITIACLGQHAEHYGRVRLWGSIGFVAAVWGIGALLDVMPVQQLPYLGLLVMGLLLLSTVGLRDGAPHASPTGETHAGGPEPIPWLPVVALLLTLTLWQVGMAPYNTFLDLHLQGAGYSGKSIGFLISFGSAAEIAIFMFMVHIIGRYGYYGPLILALGLTALRWWLIGWYPQQLGILLLAQCLHAFSFGVVHSVAIYLVAKLFPGSHRGLGLGLYVALSNGLGLLLGNLLAGYNWEHSPQQTFACSVVATLVALAIFAWFLKPSRLAAIERSTKKPAQSIA